MSAIVSGRCEMCSNCGWDEEVFEEEAKPDEQAAEDELRERLAAHHSQLYTTAVSAIRERGE